MNAMFIDPDLRECFLLNAADIWRRRNALLAGAADETLPYGARNVLAAQANEMRRALRIVRGMYHDAQSIERRRSEDYLRTCWAEARS